MAKTKEELRIDARARYAEKRGKRYETKAERAGRKMTKEDKKVKAKVRYNKKHNKK